MHPSKRRRLAVDDGCILPPDLLERILTKADVETKLACALASPALRKPLMTGRCWPQEVRLDLHDSRQLRWLQQHILVLERLSIFLEDSLIDRFNCLLRRRGAPHLKCLSIHMAPDDVEHTRMPIFELRGVPLVELSLHHRGWTPVFSPHHLFKTLRSLAFANAQESDAQVFFWGQDVRQCLSLHIRRPAWKFAHQLPSSLTHLRLMCASWHLLDGLKMLKRFPNLEEIDVHVEVTHAATDSAFAKPDGHVSASLSGALASLPLKRVGLHAMCHSLYIPDFNVAEMHRSFSLGRGRCRKLEDQIDQKSRSRVTKLTLHAGYIPEGPSLAGFSALKELVIADPWRDFSTSHLTPFTLKGLEVVAATLRHLTVSSSRGETCVELPRDLCLRSFVCVCSGTLLLHCDARSLGQGLEDVLLGFTSISGTGSGLVEYLAPRLGAVVLEVYGLKRLRQCLQFTRARLVGEWWHGVFQVSKQDRLAGCFCCRLRVWSEGRLCSPYLTFLRYGIVFAHEDREVLFNLLDKPVEENFFRPIFPGWHDGMRRFNF